MAAGHLRSACPEPPKSWEADFNTGKAAFWGPKLKQARPQWTVKAKRVAEYRDNLLVPEYRDNLLLVTDYNRPIRPLWRLHPSLIAKIASLRYAKKSLVFCR